MNIFGKKTVQLAKTKNYLDRLYDIYPNEPSSRDINEKSLEEIKDLFKEKKSEELLLALLDLDKFPIKDSYVSFLRSDKGAIKRNPKTAKRLCDTLYTMGFDKVREGIVAPKEANQGRVHSLVIG